jgi:hypothetical protein
MTDGLDQALSERFALQHDELSMPDFADVLRRATQITSRTEARKRPSTHRLPATLGVRRVLIAAVAVAALVGVGVAIATSFGAFSGISAAQHPQGPADKLDPALAAAINAENAHENGLGAGKLLPDSARFIRQLAGGERIYALSTTTNMLCVLLVGQPGSNLGDATSCGDPLSQNEPTTITSVQPDSATPPLAYGIAIDSVASVSFTAAGQEVTVPVKDNVWAYQGENSGLDALTVHFDDGSTALLHNGVSTS